MVAFRTSLLVVSCWVAGSMLYAAAGGEGSAVGLRAEFGPPEGEIGVTRAFSPRPALFVANDGQWAEERLRFALCRPEGRVVAADGGLAVQLPGGPEKTVSVGLRFVGANALCPEGLKRGEELFNYYVGSEERWRTGVRSYEAVVYSDLYDGIDLIVRAQPDGLKLEFHAAPGSDWRDITIACGGIEELAIDEAGRLVISTAWGEIFDEAPVIYQDIGGRRGMVGGRFRLVGGEAYGFEVTGAYDPGHALVIDPDLSWSTYFGGSDNADYVYSTRVDRQGSLYVAGATFSGDFPTTPGAYDRSHNGSSDVFVSKFTSEGALVWSTFLGGSHRDYGYGLGIDGEGNVYVTGGSQSTDFPTPGGYDTSHNGLSDWFIAKFSGDGALLWSTYLGGSQNDGAYAVAPDGAGDVYVSGYTASTDFPATDGAYDTSYNGGDYDCAAAKFSASGELIWSTYLGGSGSDRAYGMSGDGAGNLYVSGSTGSTDFPTTPGAYDTIYNGGERDCFVTHFSSGGGLQWSTYLGGGGAESGYGIALDGSGNVCVTGETYSDDFPTPGGFDTTNEGAPDYKDCFVSKFSASGSLTWSTYLGGDTDDKGREIDADNLGLIYVGGETDSVNFPTLRAYQTSLNGSMPDGFASEFLEDGTLWWSSYLGGLSHDSGHTITADAAGGVYLAGETRSYDFPTTPGAYDLDTDGADAFISKFTRGWTFRITNALGEAIAAMDEANNLMLAGSLTESSTPAATSGSDFLIKADDGTIVAAIDSSGNMVIMGTAHENQTSLTPPAGSFSVKKGVRPIVVAYIAASGDLYLRGEVIEGG